jgi:hypothetical protein
MRKLQAEMRVYWGAKCERVQPHDEASTGNREQGRGRALYGNERRVCDVRTSGGPYKDRISELEVMTAKTSPHGVRGAGCGGGGSYFTTDNSGNIFSWSQSHRSI